MCSNCVRLRVCVCGSDLLHITCLNSIILGIRYHPNIISVYYIYVPHIHRGTDCMSSDTFTSKIIDIRLSTRRSARIVFVCIYRCELLSSSVRHIVVVGVVLVHVKWKYSNNLAVSVCSCVCVFEDSSNHTEILPRNSAKLVGWTDCFYWCCRFPTFAKHTHTLIQTQIHKYRAHFTRQSDSTSWLSCFGVVRKDTHPTPKTSREIVENKCGTRGRHVTNVYTSVRRPSVPLG